MPFYVFVSVHQQVSIRAAQEPELRCHQQLDLTPSSARFWRVARPRHVRPPPTPTPTPPPPKTALRRRRMLPLPRRRQSGESAPTTVRRRSKKKFVTPCAGLRPQVPMILSAEPHPPPKRHGLRNLRSVQSKNVLRGYKPGVSGNGLKFDAFF